jgi:glycosyltransferase involved in cell wall biosynthesis
MKLLFIHDHPFYRDNSLVYSGGGLPNTTWLNYLAYFESLVIFGRNSKNINNKKVVSSLKNGDVKFILTENYSSALKLIFNLKSVHRELSELINKSDIVLVRLPSILGFIAAFICIKRKKKYIVEQVGNTNEAFYTHGSIIGKLISFVLDQVNKLIVRKAPFVSYVTNIKLQKDYPSNGIISSFSDVNINKVLSQQDIDQKRFLSDVIKIGLIGGFDVKYKGQNILLKAISILDPSLRDNIEIYFVGKGNFSWIKDLATDQVLLNNIKFMGPLESGKPILNLLSTLSIYVQPSLTEGMPRAMIEAMSMGCPILGSSVGGIPELISESYLHEPGDFKVLSRQIKYLCENRNILISESSKSLENALPYIEQNIKAKRDIFFSKIV